MWGSSHHDGFAHVATEHDCDRCGGKLSRVMPSTMLACDNPDCDADPKFLILEEG